MPNTYTEKSKRKTRPKINFQTDEDSKTENALSIIKKCTKMADTVNNRIKPKIIPSAPIF